MLRLTGIRVGPTNTFVGWTAGGGVEYKITERKRDWTLLWPIAGLPATSPTQAFVYGLRTVNDR
jgi:hypothetical protein